jgi:hypothetical protein
MDYRFVTLLAADYLESFDKQLGEQSDITHLNQLRLCG